MRPQIALVVLMSASLVATTPRSTQQTVATSQSARLPDQLADADFRALVADMSEPDGVFRLADNYSSNEIEVGALFTLLRQAHPDGNVFVGVGPEQNFSYIAALHPRMAFICDIRRQAVMQHLMFKAVFELAPTRADFISLLFARPRPPTIDGSTPIGAMWDAFEAEPVDPAAADRNIARVTDRIVRTHGFDLSADELAQLRHVQDAFVAIGPSITTRGTTEQGRMGMTSLGFADMTGRSLDGTGQVQTFLSTEANYQFVKMLEEKNLVVPVTGDFAGPKALRAIGAYLRAQGAIVSAFYVSNVEDYLFMDGKADAFYANAAMLPVDASSLFIRPYAMRPGWDGADGTPLCPMVPYLAAAAAGRIRTPADMVTCGR